MKNKSRWIGQIAWWWFSTLWCRVWHLGGELWAIQNLSDGRNVHIRLRCKKCGHLYFEWLWANTRPTTRLTDVAHPCIAADNRQANSGPTGGDS